MNILVAKDGTPKTKYESTQEEFEKKLDKLQKRLENKLDRKMKKAHNKTK